MATHAVVTSLSLSSSGPQRCAPRKALDTHRQTQIEQHRSTLPGSRSGAAVPGDREPPSRGALRAGGRNHEDADDGDPPRRPTTRYCGGFMFANSDRSFEGITYLRGLPGLPRSPAHKCSLARELRVPQRHYLVQPFGSLFCFPFFSVAPHDCSWCLGKSPPRETGCATTGIRALDADSRNVIADNAQAIVDSCESGLQDRPVLGHFIEPENFSIVVKDAEDC